jgi:hypothetical protein
MESSIQEAQLISEDNFRKFAKKHKELLSKQMKEFAASPKAAEKSTDELLAALEEELDLDMKTDAKRLLKTLKEANENWSHLRTTKNPVSEEGRLERRAWMLARALFLQEVEPERAAQESAANPIVKGKAPKVAPKKDGKKKSGSTKTPVK